LFQFQKQSCGIYWPTMELGTVYFETFSVTHIETRAHDFGYIRQLEVTHH